MHTIVQLRGNQKDFNFQLHYRLSKFEVPVVVNLKHIFELFGLCITSFLIQKLLELIRSSSDGQFWRKSQNIKGGKFELGLQLCYYNCKWTLPFDHWIFRQVFEFVFFLNLNNGLFDIWTFEFQISIGKIDEGIDPMFITVPWIHISFRAISFILFY